MRRFLYLKIISLMICGCIGMVSCTTSEPVKQTAMVTEQAPVTVMAPSATPLAASTRHLLPTMTATAALSSTTIISTNTEYRPKTCTTPPQRFNFSQGLGMQELSNLEFEDEYSLVFEGWTNRPDPLVTPVTPEPTPEIRPDPFASHRILVTSGQLNLLNGTFSSRPLAVGHPLSNPCGEDCPMEVISQSPDSKWQVIQVSDWVSETEGYWLVNEDKMERLVPYITGTTFRWADDSSLLWLITPYPNDRGGYTSLVQLGDSVSVKQSERGGWLDPLLYFHAFSPFDKTLVLMPSFEHGHSRTEELFQTNLIEYPMQITKARDIPGIVAVSWNTPSQNFLIEVVKEKSVEFQDLLGNTLVTIPFSTLEPIIPTLKDDSSSLSTGLSHNYALSESGQRMALVHSSGEIWVFSCE